MFFSVCYDPSALTITMTVSNPTHDEMALKDVQPSQLHHLLAAQQELWHYILGEVKGRI